MLEHLRSEKHQFINAGKTFNCIGPLHLETDRTLHRSYFGKILTFRHLSMTKRAQKYDFVYPVFNRTSHFKYQR